LYIFASEPDGSGEPIELPYVIISMIENGLIITENN